MNILDKIQNHFPELTEEDYNVIANNRELLNVLTAYLINSSKDIEKISNLPSIILRKIFYTEPIFNFIMDYQKKEDFEEFLFVIYDKDSFDDYITPENINEANRLINELQDKYLPDIINRLNNNEKIDIIISNPKVIDYIIDSNLYSRANCIDVKDGVVSEKLESFLLRALEQTNNIVINIKTPKIIEYCVKNKCINRIINTFDSNNLSDIEFIKECFDNNSITYDDIKYNSFSNKNIESPSFIIQKICAKDYLTEEQVLYIKNNHDLIEQIVELIGKLDDVPTNITHSLYDIPEIQIAFIKYNNYPLLFDDKSYLERAINSFDFDLNELLETHHDLLIDAIKYFLDNNSSQKTRIANLLLWRVGYDEIKDLVFKSLSNTDYNTLFYDYLNNSDTAPLERLIYYINKNKIHIDLMDETILRRKLPFDVFTLLLNSISDEQLNSKKINLYNIFHKDYYNDEELAKICEIIIDKCILYKSDFMQNYVSLIKKYAKPEDIQKMIDHVADLKINIEGIIEIINTDKEGTFLELLNYFKRVTSIRPDDFMAVSRILNKDNIKIIPWMLNSHLLIKDDNLYNQLILLYTSFDNYLVEEELKKEFKYYILEFFKNNNNIPARYTKFFGNEIMLKATIDSDSDCYMYHPKIFDINLDSNDNSSDYSFYHNALLFVLKEKVARGEPFSFKILTYCINNIPVSDENIKYFLNYDKMLIDIDFCSDFIKRNLNSPLYHDFILKKIIPNITKYDLNYFEIDNLINYMPELLDRLNELANKGENFDIKVFKILNYIQNENVNAFLNKIYDNNLIDYDNLAWFKNKTDYSWFFDLQHPLVDKMIINNIIPDPLFLQYWINELLKKDPKFEDYIVKEINKLDMISCQFIVPNISKYPKYYQAIIDAFEEGAVPIDNINEAYFDIGILQALLDHDHYNQNYKRIVSYLIHNYQNPSKEIMEFLIPYISEKIGVQEDSFRYLYEIYGNTIVTLLENEKFILLCKQDLETVKKIAKLLEPRPLDRPMVEAINDSIRQNIFVMKNQRTLTIFTDVIAMIQNGTFNEVREEYIEMLLPAVVDNLEEEIKRTNNEVLLNYYKTDKRLFLNYLFDCISENQNIYSDLFNTITTDYIILKRNEFGKQADIIKDTNVKYIYDTKSLYDNLFNYLLNNNLPRLTELLKFTMPTNLYDFNDPAVIDYYSIQLLLGNSIDSIFNQDQIKQIKKNIGSLRKRFSENVKAESTNELPYDLMYLLNNEDFVSKIKKELLFPVRYRHLAIEIAHLNVQVLLDKIVNNPEKYNALLEILEKYRLLDWGDTFDPTISQLSIANEIDNLYCFINTFSQIYDIEKRKINDTKLAFVMEQAENMRKAGASEETIKKYMDKELAVQFNAYKILKYSSIYSEIANCYKVLLGIDDYNIVRKNESPNASSHSIEDRMKRATEVYLKAIKEQEVSIPSFITDKHLSSGRELRAIVGNRAHPRNISHGERTGACMRALGHADSLFEFCTSDFNGFHISFVNPENDEYVSRVSGFRNGNTVFLNQLRNVVEGNNSYTDDDVVETMKLVAEEIIEKSKDSDYPIENVVASPYYALSDEPTQTLSENDIGQGVYYGYRDVNANAVVLATTGENGRAALLDLDNARHPHYKCVRVMPKEIYGNLTINDKINLQRINAIKQIIEHEDNPEYVNGIDIDINALEEVNVYTIIGQDWFITLNENNEIKYDIIPLDERAQIEFNEAMEKIEEYRNNLNKSGGLINGQ